jgi:diguanylate cyclase (GGDEF)-like protein
LRFLLDVLLGRETRQRGYVLRTLLAAFGYLLGVVIAEVALSIGVADKGPARVFQGAALTAGLISYAMVRWGWTRNFRDPAMTMTQMLVGQTMAVVAYVLLHEFRGALIGLSVAVASFGTFSLTRGRQWAMSLYALLTMGAGMLWMSVRDPMNFPPEVEAVHFLALLILQFMAALLGAQFGEMRRRLRSRKRELEAALGRIQELANRDSLTGLYNRRYAQELIDHHVHLKDRNGRPLAMALIDLDHFKQVNDQYGHAVGDRVLQTFAQQARQATRDADIVARWGGEEFLIVMPETSADGAALLVERLREALSAVAVSDAVPALRIAFSAGITAHRAGEHTDQTVHRADEALYEAKSAGRNRSVVA